jgi:hypothetical protein
MGIPYTKTVVLVWDGVDWHDQHTGIKVNGVARPGDEALLQPAQKQAEWFSPQQHVEVEEMIDRTARCLIDKALPTRTESEHDLRMRARQWAQQAAAEWLTNRVVNTDHYFVNDPSKLTSYAYVREVISRTERDVENLRARVEKMERPWWKRWFAR